MKPTVEHSCAARLELACAVWSFYLVTYAKLAFGSRFFVQALVGRAKEEVHCRLVEAFVIDSARQRSEQLQNASIGELIRCG
jgi:hypothetical protein